MPRNSWPFRPSSPKDQRRSRQQAAFTIPEVLVVVAVISLLIALLVPALRGGWETANMTSSQNRMKQIFAWMEMYSGENREFIVPSQFNYQDPNSSVNPAVKVCSDDSRGLWRYRGTWADILWTENGLAKDQVLIDPSNPGDIDLYQFHAPDKAVFEGDSTYGESPFRSTAPNSRDFVGTGTPTPGPRPYGGSASEGGLPGFFAANNFFNQDPLAAVPNIVTAKWWTRGQIKSPSQSLYLVDSVAGEVINPNEDAGAAGTLGDPYNNAVPAGGGPKPMEVDFRYNGAALMLFLDGHSGPQGPWEHLDHLETVRHVRVRNLDRN